MGKRRSPIEAMIDKACGYDPDAAPVRKLDPIFEEGAKSLANGLIAEVGPLLPAELWPDQKERILTIIQAIAKVHFKDVLLGLEQGKHDQSH